MQSVDIDPNAVNNANKHINHPQFRSNCNDSVSWLRDLPNKENIDLFRLYTVLIYLTDVPRRYGGTTSFPNLNITVTAEKNKALFWNNLLEDREEVPLKKRSICA